MPYSGCRWGILIIRLIHAVIKYIIWTFVSISLYVSMPQRLGNENAGLTVLRCPNYVDDGVAVAARFR